MYLYLYQIIGDAAYPLLPWLQKPFVEGQGFIQAQQQYNYRLSRARMCVQRAFGRLKARWRCLLKRNDHSTKIINTIIAACCTLHNICESRGEELEPNLIEDETEVTSIENDQPIAEDITGQDIRTALASYFAQL